MDYTYSTPVRLKTKARSSKPKRPPGFPLFAHASGQWAKKVRGKMEYFGVWSDPQTALDEWLFHKDNLLAGRSRQSHDPDALTVVDLGESFLQSKERKVQTGELAQCTFDDYREVAKVVVAELGERTPVEQLRPDDFAKLRLRLAKGVNLKTLEGRIAYVRAIFNHADKNGWIERSLSKIWGTEFGKPSKTALQKLSNNTERLFTAIEIQRLLKAASPQVAAMILLGINCGFGNTDIAKLEVEDIDFASGWIRKQRSKTGRLRRVHLWPETAKALKAAIKERPQERNEADKRLVFITRFGNNWIPTTKDNPLSKEFAKLRKEARITGRGKSFYSLRHTFQTIGDETKDFVAVASIMGHAPSSISDNYREKISDERLKSVTNHVHDWLFPAPTSRKGKRGAK
ncbi:MAG: site-specific integrase [Pirellulaceae bacterium]